MKGNPSLLTVLLRNPLAYRNDSMGGGDREFNLSEKVSFKWVISNSKVAICNFEILCDAA